MNDMMSMAFLNTFLFSTILAGFFWNIYVRIFNKGVPTVGTAPAIQNKVIETLREDALRKGKPVYRIIDLGSGNGEFTRQIARSMPGAHVIGIETSPKSYWWSVLLKRLQKLGNLEYRKLDFFACDLSEADAVVMYLIHAEMERVGQKLDRELKSGAIVCSNKFRLGGGWTPAEAINVKTLYPHQKMLYIYRKS
jgi:SAM-dependent methyltransferase